MDTITNEQTSKDYIRGILKYNLRFYPNISLLSDESVNDIKRDLKRIFKLDDINLSVVYEFASKDFDIEALKESLVDPIYEEVAKQRLIENGLHTPNNKKTEGYDNLNLGIKVANIFDDTDLIIPLEDLQEQQLEFKKILKCLAKNNIDNLVRSEYKEGLVILMYSEKTHPFWNYIVKKAKKFGLLCLLGNRMAVIMSPDMQIKKGCYYIIQLMNNRIRSNINDLPS